MTEVVETKTNNKNKGCNFNSPGYFYTLIIPVLQIKPFYHFISIIN